VNQPNVPTAERRVVAPWDRDFGLADPVLPLPADDELAPLQWAEYRRNIDRLNRSSLAEMLATFGHRCPDHGVEAWASSAVTYACKRDCRGTPAKLRRLIREDATLLARHASQVAAEGLPW
jgi:hypothetical protein